MKINGKKYLFLTIDKQALRSYQTLHSGEVWVIWIKLKEKKTVSKVTNTQE